MPINEIIEEPEVAPPAAERAVQTLRRAVGATDRLPTRVLLLFVVVIVCMATAPYPASLIGAAAIVLLALDTSLHRR